MQVDAASILRILAHELRSPASVAQGYLRMTLDGQLPDAAGQRQALEHARDAVGRIGALSREASDVATWIERTSTPLPWAVVDGRTLTNEMLHSAGRDRVDAPPTALEASAPIRTRDASALTAAVASLATAVGREAPDTRLMLHAHASDTFDIVMAAADVVPALLRGPSAEDAVPFPLERGGLGLSLVMATLVLDAHGGIVWSRQHHRAALGIRLPVATGHVS